MIPGDFKIVTFLTVLFFVLPFLWNIHNLKTLQNLSFKNVVIALNNSLIIQGAICVFGIPLSYIMNKFDIFLYQEIADALYTYIIIGAFMYLPSLVLLNLLKLIFKKKNIKI